MADSTSWLSYIDIVGLAGSTIGDPALDHFPPTLVGRWASDACKEFARLTDSVTEVFRTPLVPSQRLYRLPAGVGRITDVRILYPGQQGELILQFQQESPLLDSFTQVVESQPYEWYLNDGKNQDIGLYPVPSQGGILGVTSGAGNAGGTTVVLPTTASTTDDFYNNMTVRLYTGDFMGFDATITDYVGATKTATIGTAFGSQITAGQRVAVGPDTLAVEYLSRGNEWRLQDQSALVATAWTAPNILTAVLTPRPYNFYKDWEIFVTSGIAEGERARITSSKQTVGDATKTDFTYSPEFLSSAEDAGIGMSPGSTCTFQVRQVPNIQDSWHHLLADYVCGMALKAKKDPTAASYLQQFYKGIEDARAAGEARQDQEFELIREYGKGEWWGDPGA